MSLRLNFRTSKTLWDDIMLFIKFAYDLMLMLAVCRLSGHWPGLDLQPVHASLLVDGEWPRVQGDAYQPSSVLGTWGPQIYIYIWLFDGFPVHWGGSLLAADPPGCKCLNASHSQARCSRSAHISALRDSCHQYLDLWSSYDFQQQIRSSQFGLNETLEFGMFWSFESGFFNQIVFPLVKQPGFDG